MVENELVFEKKTIKVETEVKEEEDNANLDPMNSSISEILKDRADERRRKLKNFNYKFQNNRSSIDEIEKQPAYKRQGVDLNDVPKEQKVSRTTLSEDSNDDLQLRSNNSFLHDNVD
jgi:cell division protein FtsZ